MLKAITAATAAAILSTTTVGLAGAQAGPPSRISTPATPVAAPAALAAARGSIVSVRHVQHLSAGAVRSTLRESQFDASRVRYGVDAYRLVYRTVDVRQHPTTASGLVVLPRNDERRLRVISYAHGTMVDRADAPSVSDGGRPPEGLTFGSAGYAALSPDYLGLGVGPGAHPYVQLAPEVTAQLDMLRASRTFIAGQHRSIDPRVLVTGFSQGGSAAMAFGKALQQGADRRFSLAAVAPISGPYALHDQELPAAFDGRLDGLSAAFYLAYAVTSYNRTYHLYDRASDAFGAPYDRTVAPLFDGTHSEQEVVKALPASPRTLFTAAWLAQLQHPSGRFLAAVRANDTSCTGWRAASTNPAPIHLYAAHGDRDVAIGNAYACQRQLADDDVRSSLIDTGNVVHTESGKRGLGAALDWFRQIAAP